MFHLLVTQIGPRNAARPQRIDKLPEWKARQLAGLSQGDSPQLKKLSGSQDTKLFSGFRRINPRAGKQFFVDGYLQQSHTYTPVNFSAWRNLRFKPLRSPSHFNVRPRRPFPTPIPLIP